MMSIEYEYDPYMECDVPKYYYLDTKYNTLDEIEVDIEELVDTFISNIGYRYGVEVNEELELTIDSTFYGKRLDEVEYLLSGLMKIEELLKTIGHIDVNKYGKGKLDIYLIREIEQWTDIRFNLREGGI